MRIALELSIGTLYNSRRSVYARVTLSRWDTVRVTPDKAGTRILRRGRLMTWYIGRFSA